MKWDKENIILSSAAGVAVIGLGYLIWRHEESISSQRAASNLAQQQAIADNANAQLQAELQALPAVYGGTISGQGTSPSGDPLLSSIPDNTELEKILAAFFPQPTQQPAPSVPVTTTGPGVTTGNVTDPTITPTGNIPPGHAPGVSTGVVDTTVPLSSPPPILTKNPGPGLIKATTMPVMVN